MKEYPKLKSFIVNQELDQKIKTFSATENLSQQDFLTKVLELYFANVKATPSF